MDKGSMVLEPFGMLLFSGERGSGVEAARVKRTVLEWVWWVCVVFLCGGGWRGRSVSDSRSILQAFFGLGGVW